jgi:GNAT superfamily N-acetyltransferase
MNDSSTTLLKKYWFDELGCKESDLSPGKTKVVAHGKMEDYSGVKFFHSNNSTVISAPKYLIKELEEKVANVDSSTSFEINFITKILSEKIDRIIGPAFIGQIDEKSFLPISTPDARELTLDDWSLVEKLFQSCSALEIDHSSLEKGQAMAGVFIDGTLVGAAGYEILEGLVAHIGILTNPNYRGQGVAKKALSKITEMALKASLGIQYQTLDSNTASVKCAERLGFKRFATTLAARIH